MKETQSISIPTWSLFARRSGMLAEMILSSSVISIKILRSTIIDGELSTLSFDVEDDRWANKEHGNLGIAFGCIIENATGGAGHETIIGNKTDINLIGNAGNDTLNGGGGFDVLTAGPGQDTFEVQPGEGHSILMDFTDGMDQIV